MRIDELDTGNQSRDDLEPGGFAMKCGNLILGYLLTVLIINLEGCANLYGVANATDDPTIFTFRLEFKHLMIGAHKDDFPWRAELEGKISDFLASNSQFRGYKIMEGFDASESPDLRYVGSTPYWFTKFERTYKVKFFTMDLVSSDSLVTRVGTPTEHKPSGSYNPCLDSLYLVLDKKGWGNMTKAEKEYYFKKGDECDAYKKSHGR
jgi:hypothetical protein